jgi:GT2 family glycosyltransferase
MSAAPERFLPASGTSSELPLSEIEVSPILREEASVRRSRAKRRGVCEAVEVVSPQVTIRGWFLPPGGVEVHGLRAVVRGREAFVARRKQLRPDIFTRYPSRPEAASSGFTINVVLGMGWNAVELQYKGADRRWHEFRRCDLRLSPLWMWKQGATNPKASGGHEGWSREHGDADEGELEAMRSFLFEFPRRPLISVLMPVYNPGERWLRRAIESVRAQVYPHWQLCIADDCSTDRAIRRLLEDYAARDSRIVLRFLPENSHISRASNAALEMCRGEFTALLDHDDELPPHALYHVAWEVANCPECDVIFSDEDKIDEDGIRRNPYFKPGWNYDLLLGQNYVSHLGAYRTSRLREIGGFRAGYEGSQDWDLALRAIGETSGRGERVRHIPRILYHWRTLTGSTAQDVHAKPYAVEAGRLAVRDHLERRGDGPELRDAGEGKWQIIWPLPDVRPLVSLIIACREKVDLLRGLLESHHTLTDYERCEVLVVDHEGETTEIADYVGELVAAGRAIRRVPVSGPFNWSLFNNLGAKSANGEILVFLNNDMEVIQSGWLAELVRQVWREDSGAVGACLLYPDGPIQHAGISLNLSGVAGHPFRFVPEGLITVAGSASLVREVTAVTGACLAVRSDVFQKAGGFDETHLAVAYNDVDFCLRLRSMGLRNRYTPHARLVHLESASRGEAESCPERKAAATAEALTLMDRWTEDFRRDPFFNPNLSLTSEIPLADRPRVDWPWLSDVVQEEETPGLVN